MTSEELRDLAMNNLDEMKGIDIASLTFEHSRPSPTT